MEKDRINKGSGNFKLDDFQGKSNYKAPENYFDQLHTKILEQVNQEEKSKPWLADKRIWWAAASLILIAAFSWATYYYQSPASTTDLLSEVNDEDIRLYLASSDISLEELSQSVDTEDLESMQYFDLDALSDEDVNNSLELYTF